MATVEKSHVDIEKGSRHHGSVAGGGSSSDDQSYNSNRSSASESGAEIVGVSDKGRESSVSERSVELDLESGVITEGKVHLAKSAEKDCRICHMSLDVSNPESGIPIELGCSCRDDLAAAHKQCAEAWFKIKGNRTCEICGSTARNVAGANEADLVEHWNEATDASVASAAVPAQTADARNFWQGHRFLNFLLACMVFAFVISWLFHFNVPS